MSNRAVESNYFLNCSGFDNDGKPILESPTGAEVILRRDLDSGTIDPLVKCEHKLGERGTTCNASGEGRTACPYATPVNLGLVVKQAADLQKAYVIPSFIGRTARALILEGMTFPPVVGARVEEFLRNAVDNQYVSQLLEEMAQRGEVLKSEGGERYMGKGEEV